MDPREPVAIARFADVRQAELASSVLEGSGIESFIDQPFTGSIAPDEMVKGAFSSLRHVHEFLPHETGTLMVDRLVWKAPLGVLGAIADRLFLRRHMIWFVQTKQSHLKRIAETRGRVMSSGTPSNDATAASPLL